LRDLIPNMNSKSIARFYIRRWMRTLPLYYAVLVFFIIASNFIYRTNALHLFHFVFLQSFIPGELNFFSIAWSLAIEEWFYIVLPLLLFPFFQKKKSGHRILPIVLSSILTIAAIRILVVSFASIDFETVRRSIPLRFDTLLMGVLLAIIKMQYSKVYAFLSNPMFFISAILTLSFFGYYYVFLTTIGGLDSSRAYKGFGLILVSVATATLIPYLEKSTFFNLKLSKCRPIFAFISLTSAISYSLYLVHLEIFSFLIKFFSTKISAVPLFAMALAVSYGVAYVSFHFFEKPILNLRNKLTRV
jgi:peptidoglycan/LPS O-acetylase OafA/YrhL